MVDVKTIESYNDNERIVMCNNINDLTVDRVLKTLSIAKSKLMIECTPIHVKKIECSMTPLVRKNIISASKKLKMYGKKIPIVARFDEYGNKLPDEIEIDGINNGIILNFVDSNEYGEFYLELKGIMSPKSSYDFFSF